MRSSVMTMLILNWNLVSKSTGKEYHVVSLAEESNIRYKKWEGHLEKKAAVAICR